METKVREVYVSKQDEEGQIGGKMKTRQKLMLKGWAKCEHKYVLNSVYEHRSYLPMKS